MQYRRAKKIASSPFSAQRLSDLELLLDASEYPSFTFNGPNNISGWTGLSSNAYFAEQGTAVYQPFYNATAFNGLPTVVTPRTASAKRSLVISGGVSIAESEPRTLTMVISPNTIKNNSEIIGTSTALMIDFGIVSSNNIRLRSQVSGGDRNITSANGTVIYGTPHIITVTDDGNDDMNVWVDGTQVLTSALSAFDWDMNNDLGIGYAISVTSGGREFQGYMSELALYSRVLPLSQIKQLESFYYTKWGF